MIISPFISGLYVVPCVVCADTDTCLLAAGQLEKLKVDQCKVYLRKHGLRLTGNKETLIQRIREHLE